MYRWKAFLTNQTCISTYVCFSNHSRILFVRHMVSRGQQRSGGHLSVGIMISDWSHPCSYVVLSISCVWNSSCPTQPSVILTQPTVTNMISCSTLKMMCVIALILKHLLLYQTTTSESFKGFSERFNTFNIVLLDFSAPWYVIWLNQWCEFRAGIPVCPTNSKQTLNLCEILQALCLNPK